MGLMQDLKEQYQTLSIVGMAKNAGKTTALNYLIEEAMDEGILLGITSTGRDGESTDLVTGTDKPRVYLDAGTIVSIPVQLYALAEAGLEILKMTGFSTPLGELMLCRVADSGYVQIAGPVSVKDSKTLCAQMSELGAELILIDGAIDRKSVAAPGSSDAIILATGAVLSRSLKKVVQDTVHIVNLYQLPLLPLGEERRQIEQMAGEQVMLMNDGELQALDLKTSLAAGRYLDLAIDEHTQLVYLPGALTSSVLADISPDKLKSVPFVLKDPTRIFIDAVSWQQLVKKGFTAMVLENIKIAAITVNPFAPAGYSFDREQLRTAVAEAVGGIPVVDVKSGGGL